MQEISTEQYLIYLMNCAVNGRVPELAEDIDFDRLLALSRFHSVSAMVSYALDKGGYLTDKYMSENQKNDWISCRIRAMRKRILFDQERSAILQNFEEQKVWYMPLKGCILQDMYPDLGIREMADNDILFDETYRKGLREFMTGRGYDVKVYDKSVHDVYLKKPIFNFEFHVSLVDEDAYEVTGLYYKDVKERLLKDEYNDYGYHFCDDDFYIYMIVHALKHYHSAGTGIRILSDIYVYLRAKGAKMDWKYIEGEMRKLGEVELESRLRALALMIFDCKKDIIDMVPEEEQDCELLAYLLGSGTYGTISNRVQKDLENMQADGTAFTPWVKIKFLLRRLIPDAKHMGKYAPFCKRHKWSIPFFWIYRIVRGVLVRSSSIVSELHAVKKAK